MTKMTYAVAIDNAIAAMGECEATDRLRDLKAQLAKRGSGSRGKTKTQKENEGLKENIMELLADGGLTATEVAEAIDVTVHKATALLKQLVDDGKLVRVKDGRVLHFELA